MGHEPHRQLDQIETVASEAAAGAGETVDKLDERGPLAGKLDDLSSHLQTIVGQLAEVATIPRQPA